jgi:hypothetical protein
MGAVQERYEGHTVEEFGEQGYCSCTLLFTPVDATDLAPTGNISIHKVSTRSERKDAFIVQLRPALHALDFNIMRAASTAYPTLAPTIRPLDLVLPGGLCAYEMERLPGTPLSHLLPRERTLNTEMHAKLERLITSFAYMIARCWHSASPTPHTSRSVRADSPMDPGPDMLLECPGKVGSTIVHRLEKLSAELPDAQLRERAEDTLRIVQHMTDYPVVLNHGDLIPSNILVDERTWEITGLVDWAEAELLPFGTCLYGLEHLLGYMAPPSPDSPTSFVYFNDAAGLRELFWNCLFDAVPGLCHREKGVKAVRDLGVLLWHGIAWDDGAINRVVNQVEDVEELAKLRAFLGVLW